MILTVNTLITIIILIILLVVIITGKFHNQLAMGKLGSMSDSESSICI